MAEISRINLSKISLERGLYPVTLSSRHLVSVRDDMLVFDTPEAAVDFAREILQAVERAAEPEE